MFELDHLFFPAEYYTFAMDYMRRKFKRNVKFYVASDNVQWCKMQNFFESDDVVILNSTSAILDMAVLIECDHIVLSIGTFGWWSAWLGAHQKGGEVLCFKDSFVLDHPVNAGQLYADDHFPPEWISLSLEHSNTKF